jgi:hypothetical protein
MDNLVLENYFSISTWLINYMINLVYEIFLWNFVDGVIYFFVEFSASTKDLLGGMQNSDGGLRLNASTIDSLPQLVENPCIKKSNLRYVWQFNFCNCFEIMS